MKKLVGVASLFAVCWAWSLERQPSSDYHARREALSKKTKGGAVLLFAPLEAEGPNAVYGFRQDDNFYYLSGWTEPGAALLIVPAAEASGDSKARPYTEILFLAANNKVEEKWTGPKLSATDPQAAKVTGFDRVEVMDKLRDELNSLLPERPTVYTDLSFHTVTILRLAAASTGSSEQMHSFPLLRIKTSSRWSVHCALSKTNARSH
jgi:Xaa-Pro aminopeptidase